MDKMHFSGFFLKFSAFYYQPRGLVLVRFFFEKSRSNIWGIYESTPQTLFEKDSQNSNSEESSENQEIFSASKFGPATGIKRFCFTMGLLLDTIIITVWYKLCR